MEPKKFTSNNYIHVPGFAVVELGLSGNELLCYSLIYGFTQDHETEFNGSLSYIASALNVTRQNAKKILDRLIERGMVIKREIYISGVKLCRYVLNSNGVAEIATGCYQNSNGGVAETATGGVAKTATNNKIDNNKEYYDNKAADGGLFPEEVAVKRPRGTSEPASCLFENSRFVNFDAFLEQFRAPEYNDVDIAYYYHAVADWSAQRGKKMKDWIATTRNFIRGDMEKGKLHRLSFAAGLSADAVEYLKQMGE